VPPNARAAAVARGHRFAAYPRCSADLKEATMGADLAIVALTVLLGVPPLDPKAQAAAVEYAKHLPVSTIESGLPDTTLEHWLRRAVGATRLKWFISGCDLKPDGESPKQSPLCIGAEVGDQDPFYLRFHLAVGNLADGVSGKPYVLPQSFMDCNHPANPLSQESFHQFERLSAIPGIVEQLQKSCRGAAGRRTRG
jgi:hypothetical protein